MTITKKAKDASLFGGWEYSFLLARFGSGLFSQGKLSFLYQLLHNNTIYTQLLSQLKFLVSHAAVRWAYTFYADSSRANIISFHLNLFA